MVCPFAPGLSLPWITFQARKKLLEKWEATKKRALTPAPTAPKCGPKTSKAPLSFPLTHYGWKRHSIAGAGGVAFRLRRHAEDDDVDAEKWVLLQRLPFLAPNGAVQEFCKWPCFFFVPALHCVLESVVDSSRGFFFFGWFPGGQVEQ